jgi:glutathione S-transferase
MSRTLDVTTSYLTSVARLGAGMVASHRGDPPEKTLILYEFEACPFCRKVRDALTAFDLDAMIYPCPRGSRHRASVKEAGGKNQFPYLVDPNTGRSMYESDDIIRYLADTYRGGAVPLSARFGPLNTLSSVAASTARPTRGRKARPAKAPEKPLELWSFEASPYCRIAREVLAELQIPYLLHNVGKRSAKREAFVARSGKMMVPYLVDPNTGREMFESAEIARYLEETYAE